MDDFDFDGWKTLAEQDPAAFFRARDEVLRRCIARCATRAGALAEFQARIDATRALAGSPLQASRALFELMEEQLRLLGFTLIELQQEVEALRAVLARGHSV